MQLLSNIEKTVFRVFNKIIACFLSSDISCKVLIPRVGLAFYTKYSGEPGVTLPPLIGYDYNLLIKILSANFKRIPYEEALKMRTDYTYIILKVTDHYTVMKIIPPPDDQFLYKMKLIMNHPYKVKQDTYYFRSRFVVN